MKTAHILHLRIENCQPTEQKFGLFREWELLQLRKSGRNFSNAKRLCHEQINPSLSRTLCAASEMGFILFNVLLV
jgi:hypothetical protein